MSRYLVLLAVAVSLGTQISQLGWLLVHAAQPAQRIVRVGVVSQLSPSVDLRSIRAFSQRLRELGYLEGQSLFVEVRWADGHIDRLPALTAELLQHKVDVIIANATLGAVAAKNATSTIPIVGVGMGDPVHSGLAASLGRR